MQQTPSRSRQNSRSLDCEARSLRARSSSLGMTTRNGSDKSNATMLPCCVDLPVSTTNGQRPTASPDELWMEEALRAAQRALEADEVPVGAIVVRDGKIIGRGWNQNIRTNDPTAHAEIIALREAGANVGNHRLAECELFVTIEPCSMCAGSMVHARIKRLIYGANDPKAGAVQSLMQVLNHPQLNHKVEVRSGVLAGRSAELLQTFFKSRR